MAVEQAAPARPQAHKTQAHAAAGHHRAGAPGDAAAPAAGFSAMLGAATDAAPADADTDANGLPAGKGRKAGKTLVGGVDDTGTPGAAWAGMVPPAPALPTTALAGGTAKAGSALSVAPADALTGLAQGAQAGKGMPNGALAGAAAAKPLPKLIPPGGKTAAPAGLPGPDAAALQAAMASAGAATAATASTVSADATAASTTTPAHPGASHGLLAAGAPGQAVPGAPLTGAQQLRANDVVAQAAAGRVQATAPGAGGMSMQGVNVSASGTSPAGEGDGDGRMGRSGASTVSLGDGAGRWAPVLSDIGRSPQSEAGAGAFSGGASHGQGAEGERRGGDGMGSSAIGFAPTTSGTDSGQGGTAGTADAQGVSAGTVMTPDEWLAATTPALAPRGVQTAELTMDAFGSPVDVQISLSGNDAQVAFQSDQPETREMLVSAVSDLQNLLQQEGLVLSGVTVGGSGAQASGGSAADGGNPGESRRGSRMESAPVEALAAAPARPRPVAAGNGALDVFA